MASLSTSIFERLFFTYMAIALLVGAAVIAWLFYSMWRFRWRPGDPRPADAPRAGVIPAERGHALWAYVMAGAIAAIMFGLAFSTISATDTLEHPPEGEPLQHYEVIGLQFGWRFEYAGEGGVAFSKPNEWTVPLFGNIVANVTSIDVWHNFAIPDYRIRIDAVPGETTHIWFRPEATGEELLVCVQLCGSGHANMRATLRVVEAEDYAAFLQTESDKAYANIAKAGNARNVTWDGATLTVDNATLGPKAVALLVKNTAASAIDVKVESGDATREARIEPGATTRLSLVPAAGEDVTVSAAGASLTLEASQ